MTFEFIAHRVAFGAMLVFGLLFGAWLSKYILFPAIVLIVVGVVCFLVGDMALYVINNFETIKGKFKAHFGGVQ